MATLQDVYEELKAPQTVKASYIMQFLWRDLTSDFDVIGPYFSSNKGMECKFVISCLMTTIQAFHIYGFKTMAVVCDGASTNLKAVKHLTTGYLKPLYLLQKKAVRVIIFSPLHTSSKPLFSKHNILSLYSIYKFHVACFVFSHFNSLLPTPVSSILHFNSEYHDYMTSSRFNLHKTCHKYQFAITWQE